MSGPRPTRLVVRQQRPGRLGQLLLGGLVLLAVAAGGGYFAGQYYSDDRVAVLMEENDFLQQQLAQTRKELSALRQEVIQARQSSRLDRETLNEVNGALREMEQHNAQLEEELVFFRGIMAPEEKTGGLQVRELVLEPGEGAGSYRFNLVLTQMRNNDSALQGQVTLGIKGRLAGEEKILGWEEVADGPRELKFRFRYFQNLDGGFNLPDGFVPEAVSVEAKADGKRPESAKKVFPWPFEEGTNAGQ